IAHARSETLLLNILPASIAKRLKEHPDATIADDYPSATVLFADLVGFTEMCTLLSPNETVDLLNRIYSHFDTLAEKYGLEKIKTIGDAYMVVGGVPVETDRHARSVGLFALRLQEIAKSFSFEQGAISLRIGIHTGRLVAGVIGKKKFSYDVWGDTVNIANRMESHGVPGKIHCSEAFHAQARADFDFTERGEVDIKGKGKMRTYFLEKQKPSAPPPGSSAKAG
ncbi:MAG TPA: adenylate/guanylate cyclase domain-containing protein, partial [Elusimicrobiota bacterium]|nr:adenylate/guanylate cyclase domain-containing protein [Elusimicrobiota bacterium]